MKYLLDTHAFLWIIEDNKNLTEKVKHIYLDNSHDMFLSVASIWEMAIKISLGKLTIKGKLNRFIDKQTLENNILLLDISPHHVIPIEKLPFHHRDPFDRLLISQCIQDKMKIISRDTQFDKYSVQRVW
jgi:PIN domain nuclease of toxin-antitoxin system